MDDFKILNYTTEEIDALLKQVEEGGSGGAPDGFGLGPAPAPVPTNSEGVQDIHLINGAGWFNFSPGALNSPKSTNYGWVLVEHYNSGGWTQLRAGIIGADEGQNQFRKHCWGGTWRDWERADTPFLSTHLADGTDLNTLVDPGVYSVVNATNIPSGLDDDGILVIYKNSQSVPSLVQLYYPDQDDVATNRNKGFAYRTQESGVWRPWYVVGSVVSTAAPTSFIGEGAVWYVV